MCYVSQIPICDFCSTILQENLVLELEAVKEVRRGMGRCLELMKYVRKDLETMTENFEMLEGIYN